jgi:hypothetical protein
LGVVAGSMVFYFVDRIEEDFEIRSFVCLPELAELHQEMDAEIEFGGHIKDWWVVMRV